MDFIQQVQDMTKNWGEFGKDLDMEKDIQQLFMDQASWPIKGSISVDIQIKIIRYRLLLPFFIAKLLTYSGLWFLIHNWKEQNTTYKIKNA